MKLNLGPRKHRSSKSGSLVGSASPEMGPSYTAFGCTGCELHKRLPTTGGKWGLKSAFIPFFFCLELEHQFPGEDPLTPSLEWVSLFWSSFPCLVFLALVKLGIVHLCTDLFITECPTRLPAHKGRSSLCVSSTWHIVGVGSYLWNEGPRAEVEQGMEVKREDEIKVQVSRRDLRQAFLTGWALSGSHGLCNYSQVPAQLALGPSRTSHCAPAVCWPCTRCG